MDNQRIRAAVLALLLCLGGCRSPGPVAVLPQNGEETPSVAVRDPFLDAVPSFPLPFAPQDVPVEAAIPAFETPLPETPLHDETAEAEDGEPEEEIYRASTAEQEAILAKDAWVRNVVLDRWIENGMKNPFPSTKSSTDRRRADDFDRLNLSNKDREKRQSRESIEYVTGLVSTWRWYHLEMEQLASIPHENRSSPEIFLRSEKYADKKHRALRANAAILLGRDGDPLAADELLEIVRDKTLRTELRCGAVETLGKLPNVTGDMLLPLIKLFRERETEITNPQTGLATKRPEPGIPLLWQELLYALAEKVEPWEHPCFLEPFTAKTFETRLAAARLWRLRSTKQPLPANARLPEAFLEHARLQGGEAVRIEIIRTLGAWKTPNLFELIGHDLNRTAALRGAALDALAEADCRDALPQIRQRLRDTEGANRAQAVAALRKLGCYEDVFKMSNDTDTKVRIEVAKTFTVQRNERSLALAKRYLTENNERLQTATLDAVARWPIEQQGILLLDAAKGPVPKIRGRAADALAGFGIDTDGFKPEEQPKAQEARHAELVRSFQKHIAGRDTEGWPDDGFDAVNVDAAHARHTAVSPSDPLLQDVRRCLDEWQRPVRSRDDRQTLSERLVSLGDRLLPYLQYLYEVERRTIPASLDPVLAEVDPFFEAMLRLDSPQPNDVRKGASELQRLAEHRDAGPLVTARILARASKQYDPLVLASLLETLKKLDADAAGKLAETLLDAESADLRRKACAALAECGGDPELLVGLLQDPNRDVLRSALEAVVSLLGEETDRTEITAILRNRLMQDDPAVQVDVAAALHRLGDGSGADTLRRLAASQENGVRVYVAKTLTALEDPVFLPILIWYLDDRSGSVRKAALDGLPKLAGKDVGRIEFDHSYSPEISLSQQRTERWKKWYEQEFNSAK